MARKENTNRFGNAWTAEQKKEAWNKAKPVDKKDADLYRADKCGQLMYWFDFGKRDIREGWDVDHIVPVEQDGGDEPDNLQALNWRSNDSKGDQLFWNCK